jgi:hypothetical protein
MRLFGGIIMFFYIFKFNSKKVLKYSPRAPIIVTGAGKPPPLKNREAPIISGKAHGVRIKKNK